ncbi:hypothetical protein CDAR_24301 [Caerostris darwini]|uniref:Uncharacterized protein n=1 Tax=Caerostris darwini TaxID=1538125 RepID=A0AAV4QHX6_9ARAC|nr:hypothetical protein CDAR_24301 [Caerostris darwini]
MQNQRPKLNLKIFVTAAHGNWHSKLLVIHFAMNIVVCDTTGYSPAYRAVDEDIKDFNSVVESNNIVAEITPFLNKIRNCRKRHNRTN